MDLKKKVESMWNHITKNPDGQVERLACWDFILADQELAALIGTGDAAKGTEVLQAMKEVKALDQIKQDGHISEQEFSRLCDPAVLTAASKRVDLKAKVHAMWAEITKDADGQVERIACWDFILADKELAALVGDGNAAKGTSLLEAMKEVKALDQVKKDGRISEVSPRK